MHSLSQIQPLKIYKFDLAFSVKGQRINIFGYVDHMVCSNYSTLPCTVKAATDTVWLCANKTLLTGASLVAQWLKTHLPMQGAWVRALVREDPKCHGATKPVRHNY